MEYESYIEYMYTYMLHPIKHNTPHIYVNDGVRYDVADFYGKIITQCRIIPEKFSLYLLSVSIDIKHHTLYTYAE